MLKNEKVSMNNLYWNGEHLICKCIDFENTTDSGFSYGAGTKDYMW